MSVQGFLREIIEIKSAELTASANKISIATMRRNAEQAPACPDFLKALEQSGPDDIGIIAEIKKASPSKGDIKPGLDPAACAETYTIAGARAISVLTESRYFKGSTKDLETACQNTVLPVLRKDFIINEYQIYEARAFGASSALLITTILSKNQLDDYIMLARELGMEPLVEITSEQEFETAYNAGARIIDINNRNLQTLETDLKVSERIAPILPGDIIPVEASGISRPKDIEKALEYRIFNFLVGESIVRSDDPESFIRELRNAD